MPTRATYRLIADTLRTIPDREVRATVAWTFIRRLELQARFDPVKFLAACDLSTSLRVPPYSTGFLSASPNTGFLSAPPSEPQP